MKVTKIDYSTYNHSDDTLSISCDREAGQSILAHIVKIQEDFTKFNDHITKQAILLAECREFVNDEMKKSIDQLNKM